MIEEQLITVATFGNAVEAELAKNRLEAEGIGVFLGDEDTVGLWNLGNNLGVVKLQVASADQHRARHILAHETHRSGSSPVTLSAARIYALWAGWICSQCGNLVRPRLTACPSCETALDDSEGFRDIVSSVESPADEAVENISALFGDQLALRAWRAAVVGFLLFPLHAYALWILIRLAFFKGELSSKGMNTLYAALGLEASALLLAVLLFRLAFLTR